MTRCYRTEVQLCGRNPKVPCVLLWGILPQIIKELPEIETLHSTVWVLRTIWARTPGIGVETVGAQL